MSSEQVSESNINSKLESDIENDNISSKGLNSFFPIIRMNQLASSFETYINRNLTMDDIESFRESCPVKVMTHGIMGK